MTSSRVFWITILVSTVAHLALYVLFGWTWTGPGVGGPAGFVSIDLIESVVHDGNHDDAGPASPARPARARRPKRVVPRVTSDHGGPADAATAVAADTSAVESAPTRASGSGGPVGGGGDRFVADVARLINARKVYPRAALSRELEGRVVVAITLDATGHLLASVVEEASPYQVLNDAALTAVRAVAVYPALPPASGDSLHLHVPLIFKISR